MANSKTSIWQAMRHHYRFSHHSNQRVRRHIASLQRNRRWVYTLSKRSEPYIYYIYQQVLRRGMPAEVALVPMLESHFKPRDLSRTGASGLWQLQPVLARDFHLQRNRYYDGRDDVVAATQAALKQLSYLHKRFGSWLLAFAAYNCGEGRVAAAIRYNRRHHRPTDFWHLNLPEETRHYVPGLLAFAKVLANPRRYGITIYAVPNRPYFTTTKVTRWTSLKRFASTHHMSLSALQKLNPALLRGVISPSLQQQLLIPLH